MKYPSVFDAKNYIIKYKNFKSKQYHYPLLEYTVFVERSDSNNPLVDDNFSPVWGVTDVESQLAVVVLHDGGSSVGERPLLEQGHGTAPETAPSHTGPEMGLQSYIKE